MSKIERDENPDAYAEQPTLTELVVAHKGECKPVIVDNSMTLWRMLDRDTSPLLDFVWTTMNGHHGRLMNNRSTKLYYVSSGHLELRTDKSVSVVSEGGVCVIPPVVWCEISGTDAEVGIACAPAFDPNDEETD